MSFQEWVEQELKENPEFRRAYYAFQYRDPLPIMPRKHSHKYGREYHRRRKTR